jgi:hypothetical protein
MVKGFYEDLKKAKKGEQIVLEVLRNANTEYDFDDVSNDKEYWHRGDIECWDDTWLCSYYIDVKDDGCVSSTGNILAEHRVWYKGSGWKEGFMQSATYDYVAYLSQPDNKIYLLDFEAWKKQYKKVFCKDNILNLYPALYKDLLYPKLKIQLLHREQNTKTPHLKIVQNSRKSKPRGNL